MKFKDLKPGTFFCFTDRPGSVLLLSLNRETRKSDVIAITGNCWNFCQLYEKHWDDKDVKELPVLKSFIQTYANGLM